MAFAKSGPAASVIVTVSILAMALLMDAAVADVTYCYKGCEKACESSPRQNCLEECKQEYCVNHQHCVDACCANCEHKRPFFKECLAQCTKQYCNGMVDFSDVSGVVRKPVKCRRRRA